MEDNAFVKDESGSNKRISLVNNIVRWREVKNPDGTTSVSGLVNTFYVHVLTAPLPFARLLHFKFSTTIAICSPLIFLL